VKRYAKYFSNLSTLTTLFMSLVRSTLEYGSVIWTPYYKTHVDRLEKVRGHYKCLSQLVGVAAHLKHSAQPPTMRQSFIMTCKIQVF
jgi:hypothetical protein